MRAQASQTTDAEFKASAAPWASLLAWRLAIAAGSSESDGEAPTVPCAAPVFLAMSGPLPTVTCNSTVPVDSLNIAWTLRDPSDVCTQFAEWSGVAVTPVGNAPFTTLSQSSAGGVAHGTPGDGFA